MLATSVTKPTGRCGDGDGTVEVIVHVDETAKAYAMSRRTIMMPSYSSGAKKLLTTPSSKTIGC